VRERLTSLQTTSVLAGSLVHYGYQYDPVSNVTRIDDLRPFDGPHGVPAQSPRRNTQRFEYDDLYRLTRARYTPVSDESTLGTITFAYDAIGNMLSQVSENAAAHLGQMTYAGGRSGRNGRAAGDPPGPHALTGTADGGSFEYDPNGNMTEIDGATLTWDFRDRLVRFQSNGIDARYVYDYTNRRVSKLVSQDGRTDQTLYVDPNFEYRPNRSPTKYVFGGVTRIAQVTGTLDPQRPRLQRIWLYEGLNLVTVAVQTFQSAEEIFGSSSRVFEWTGTQYQEVAGGALIPIAKPLWVEVPSARIAVAQGMYEPAADAVVFPPGQSLLAWPRLEPLVPDRHLLPADVRIQAHDAQGLHWLLTDRSLPVGVADPLPSFDAATAVWLTLPSQATLMPAAAETSSTMFYHGDHLGSASIMTDRDGALVQEIAYFPFGEVRHSHEPNVLFSQPYGFTGKEQDSESGLHYFEERYLTGRLGRFASVDPKYVSPDALGSQRLSGYLAQPQDLNLYAYSRNNPIRYVDPNGLTLSIGSILAPAMDWIW
jgi:RHS repeat-associated protein